jgi:DNA segregation ATPase FtsK/SpoIIIE-like protein
MIFISISIITYDKLDPSSLNAIKVLNIHNFFGIYGADIADILMQIFGYSIILPIAFFFIFAIKALNNKPNKFFIYRTLGILFGTLISSFSGVFNQVTKIPLETTVPILSPILTTSPIIKKRI